MWRIIFALALVLGIARGTAFAQTAPTPPVCQDSKISNISGLQIRLTSGLKYSAYPGSLGRISMWLPQDKVTVCRLGGSAVQITNLSRKSQSVKALQNNSMP